ncbi:MAG: NUDIX domain-containing protein [Chloroflexi bacterium]|nr:NUDIX domain-containing protein [Chloroflexota bacterium]
MRDQFPVTVHIFFLREESILLLRRLNTGYEDGNYSVVSGHVERGETVTQAAIREASEEVGVTIQPQNFNVIGIMHRKSNDERIDFFLTNTIWSGELTNREPNKCDELTWFSVNSLPANTIPYIRCALENYQKHQQSMWFEEFGW